ncbi:hypothetical protein BJF78_09610 [Pseudonocardia sp. CNS-139]|nr:hypothetical protein BJF78_09610 [Pseudonocardia sp. CNS-139]
MLGVYPQGEKDVYRVTAQDGASTLACGEHLWTVRTASDRRRDQPWRVLETQEMIGDLRAAHARRFELPMLTAPVQHPGQPVPMDPYALGLLLGDGATTPAHATRGQELASAASPTAVAVRQRVDAPCVPEAYLRNTAEVRLALLQGMLDAHGEPVRQAGRTCRVEYSTLSPHLRDGVVELVRSLGGVGYVRDAHVVDLLLPEGIEPFRLERKRDEYLAAGGGGRPMRFVDSIEPAGRAETVCIQVAAEDSLYVTEDHLLTHNTLNDAFIILDEAQNTTPEQMKMFLTRLGFGSKIVVTGDVTQVDLPGGVRSGLMVVRDILGDVDDVHFAQLASTDVVRHRLVADIVDAYARWDAESERPKLRAAAPRNGPPQDQRRRNRR